MFKSGKVYKIVSPNTDRVYIGCTRKPLRKRLKQHVLAYKSYQKGSGSYVSSFDLVKQEFYKIELLEHLPKANRKMLLEAESKYINSHDNCVNIRQNKMRKIKDDSDNNT